MPNLALYCVEILDKPFHTARTRTAESDKKTPFARVRIISSWLGRLPSNESKLCRIFAHGTRIHRDGERAFFRLELPARPVVFEHFHVDFEDDFFEDEEDEAEEPKKEAEDVPQGDNVASEEDFAE